MFTPKKGLFKYSVSDIQEKQFKRSGCFNTIPKGIVLLDTYNNPYYPNKEIELDSSIYNTKFLKEDFNRNYGADKLYLNLPWHFTIELVGIDYNVNCTRPLVYRSAIPDWEEYISFCILGNTDNDIYNNKIYKHLANIINSFKFIPGWKLKTQELEFLNIGDSFKRSQLKKELL